MTTKTADSVAQLRRKRDNLIEEETRLRAEGEQARLRGQDTGQIGRRLAEIGSELPGINADMDDRQREAGQEQARALAIDREFQAQVRAFLAWAEPLITFDAAIKARRATGTAIPPLPTVGKGFTQPEGLARLAAEARAYLAELRRKGAIEGV